MCRAILAVVLSIGMACSAFGQSTFGSIVGVVRDPSRAAVAGATVEIRSLEDNSTHAMTSDENGAFEFVNLKPGNYAVSIEAPGFADFKVPSAQLVARQALRIDAVLSLQSQSQTVEVTDTGATINTENGVINDAKDTSEITQLPLNFRAATTSPLAAMSTSPNVEQDSQGNIA